MAHEHEMSNSRGARQGERKRGGAGGERDKEQVLCINGVTTRGVWGSVVRKGGGAFNV